MKRAETKISYNDLDAVTGTQRTVGGDLPVCVECPDDYDVNELTAEDIASDSAIRVLTRDEAIDCIKS